MAQPSKNWSYINANSALTKNFVHAFVFAKAGYKINLVFGLIEYTQELSDPSVIKALAEKVNAYYFDDDIWNEEVNGETQELQFENTLQKINNRIKNLVNNYQGLDPNQLKVIIGCLLSSEEFPDKAKLCVSYAGKNNKVLLFHQLKSGQSKIIDVLSSDTESVNPLRIFSQIITGHLTLADKIFLSPQALYETVSIEEIKRAVTSLHPLAALEHLKNQVNKAGFSFGGAIIKATDSRQGEVLTGQRVGSVQKIHQDEMQTEKLLAPALSLNIFTGLARLPRRLLAPFSRLSQTDFSLKSNLLSTQLNKLGGDLKENSKTFYFRSKDAVISTKTTFTELRKKL
ncbi:hypothetical protein HY224_02035, partial [Candidatus Uhrbacteria bacterium]|nr:hypothetical protein [Candidatus Uhrbacteria bacterium]